MITIRNLNVINKFVIVALSVFFSYILATCDINYNIYIKKNQFNFPNDRILLFLIRRGCYILNNINIDYKTPPFDVVTPPI